MFNFFSLLDLFRAVPLGAKLFSLLKLRRPPYSYGKPAYIKRGYAVLNSFIEVTESFISFSTTPKQRREIIFYFVWMSRLIDNEFDSKILTQANFRDAVFRNDTSAHALIPELTKIIRHVKNLSSNNPHYNDFTENLVKTWRTHRTRDLENNKETSSHEALQAGEARGGVYCLSLIAALNPIGLNLKLKDAIYVSGAWFQLIDDYLDREKDLGEKNTVFTTSETKLHGEIFKQHRMCYQKQLSTPGSRYHALTKYFGSLTSLMYIISLMPSRARESTDWR